eukprot:2742508-Pleurochrysis_carterae.AAC.2
MVAEWRREKRRPLERTGETCSPASCRLCVSSCTRASANCSLCVSVRTASFDDCKSLRARRSSVRSSPSAASLAEGEKEGREVTGLVGLDKSGGGRRFGAEARTKGRKSVGDAHALVEADAGADASSTALALAILEEGAVRRCDDALVGRLRLLRVLEHAGLLRVQRVRAVVLAAVVASNFADARPAAAERVLCREGGAVVRRARRHDRLHVVARSSTSEHIGELHVV